MSAPTVSLVTLYMSGIDALLASSDECPACPPEVACIALRIMAAIDSRTTLVLHDDIAIIERRGIPVVKCRSKVQGESAAVWLPMRGGETYIADGKPVDLQIIEIARACIADIDGSSEEVPS